MSKGSSRNEVKTLQYYKVFQKSHNKQTLGDGRKKKDPLQCNEKCK